METSAVDVKEAKTATFEGKALKTKIQEKEGYQRHITFEHPKVNNLLSELLVLLGRKESAACLGTVVGASQLRANKR